MSDAGERAARYRARRDAGEAGEAEDAQDAVPSGPRGSSPEDRAAYVETAIQIAIRRGEFDDLPGAGKPLQGLGTSHDPDWWIRRKIQSENLTGLGPPALLLRAEDKRLDDDLDLFGREDDVRHTVDDFNRRVREARRQLQGGPPVVTATRDVEAEVESWRARRERRRAAQAETEADDDRAVARRRGLFRRRG